MLQAAHSLDRVGNKAARGQIAAAKALAPSTVVAIIDRAIQVRRSWERGWLNRGAREPRYPADYRRW